MRGSPVILIALVAAATGGLACSGGKSEAAPATTTAAAPADAGLTPFQQENGIGPVTQVITLGPIDHDEAEEGKKLFEGKCTACHKMGERYVGPALGGVTERRTPAYIMNMILNPEEMYTKHPVARQLLAEHMTQMPNLGLTQEQAREVVEYLRTQSSPTAGS
jgi:mono/diheme cytochrome c family protein